MISAALGAKAYGRSRTPEPQTTNYVIDQPCTSPVPTYNTACSEISSSKQLTFAIMEVAAGAIAAEQVVSTTIEAGVVTGLALAQSTQPLHGTFTRFAVAPGGDDR
jgi:hypothetical protein